MLSILKSCNLCPRECNVDRYNSTGFCHASEQIVIAKAYLHKWEEPCISGINGSGCVFFTNCNLKCIYCQNYEISQASLGKIVSIEKLADIMLDLQLQGAHNINLVTPTHYCVQIIEAIKIAKFKGLNIPIVYNTNSYELPSTIKLLKGYVDIFLADLKYIDEKKSIEYSAAPNYYLVATKAIDEMFKLTGPANFDENGMMKSGVIVRHLMLPGMLLDTKKIISNLYNKYKNDIYLSLMNQYTPMYKAVSHSKLALPLNPKQYENAIEHCEAIGFENVFIQEDGTSTTSYVPDFNIPEF